MSVVVYPALVSPAPEDGSGAGSPRILHARFVDFPDLVSSGGAAAELIRAAREALSAELRRLEARGDTWPEPSALGAVEVPAGASIVLVDVSVDDTPVRLTISLGERLLKRIDDDAAARSMTRSGYLALGARRLLGEPGAAFGEAAFGGAAFGGGATGAGGDTAQRLQEEIAALARRVNETLGPHSPIGRTLADLDAMALDGLRRLGGEVRSAMRNRAVRDPNAPGDGVDPAPSEPPADHRPE